MFDCRLFNIDEDEVRRLLRHPHAAIALSDAGAHLSFLCDAGFGVHLFGHWARERGDLTLEQAVRAVTSAVADAYRIAGRGRLQAGAWADLLLFDPRGWTGAGSAASATCPPAPAGSTPPAVSLRGVGSTGHAPWTSGAGSRRAAARTGQEVSAD